MNNLREINITKISISVILWWMFLKELMLIKQANKKSVIFVTIGIF